jgi:ATP-dependent exoDNAse (exonuclease V) beta subunit
MPAAEDEKDAARVFYVAATRATLRWLIVSVRLWQSTDTESTAERHVNMHGL